MLVSLAARTFANDDFYLRAKKYLLSVDALGMFWSASTAVVSVPPLLMRRTIGCNGAAIVSVFGGGCVVRRRPLNRAVIRLNPTEA